MMRGAKPPVPAPRHSQINPTEERPPLPVRPKKGKILNDDAGKLSESSQLEELKDFALRKNFTLSQYEKAISRTTLPVDTNEFLTHLLAVGAEYDVKDLHEEMRQQVPRPRSVNASESLRNIVIDGSNVAMTHGNGKIFSSRGIQIAVQWFQQRGHHSIKVFVPSHRKEVTKENRDVDILHSLESEGFLKFTPSRENRNGSRVTCYDDRFILKCASDEKAIVVSNDHFKDLVNEDPAYNETIEQRLLGYVFANDRFMPAEDPMGKKGLTLDQFLRVRALDSKAGHCPYGRKCTYGTKCKYAHPEREKNSAIVTDFQSQKARQRELVLHEYGQRTKNEQNNNTHSTPEITRELKTVIPLKRVECRRPISLNHHGSHPSNVCNMPMLVARGPSEHPSLEQQSNGSAAASSGTALNAENSMHKIMPVVNGTQMTIRSTTYSPHGQAYTPTYPHFNRQPILPGQLTISNVQQKPVHFRDGTNINFHKWNAGSDFTKPSHPRYNIYYHLQGLFPENDVITAMTQRPHETDSKVLCKAILELS